ncbi:MAG: HAMP domain-containing histidine kinase [Sphingomonas sp.]|uniref:sensor histidine kinase n=1 Tax=Sphingomonas sp. TaxID=28214 RepID=UPI00261DBF1E|nr:HAMP domain-containing sensor histidine kinase [Sphingomonas sp.]MDK2767987.1 HAMP domain-containing histidine kinase [Sphingomonas sp.]
MQLVETEAKHTARAELQGLVDRYRRGGLSELQRFIEQRSPALAGDYVYALAGPDDRVIVGDLATWPEALSNDGWHVFTAAMRSGGGLRRREIEGQSLQIAPGYRLLVAHPPDGRARLRKRFFGTLGWAMAATLLIGLGLGWWISRRTLRFVNDAATIGERFLQGKLDERLPVSSQGDEFDHLAEVVNSCFSEVERTVGGLRAATDGMAHDLKTPLTRMKARLELALLRGNPPTLGLLDDTTRDIDALLKLINDLLALSSAEAANIQSFTPVDLASIAREAYELYEPVAGALGQALILDLEPSPAWGSRALLLHATANLIDNALKYGGGKSPVEIRTLSSASSSQLSVADRGPGIAAPDRERALERLVRLDASRAGEGSGLGLSIASAIARVHGGSVELTDNSPGIRAILELPAKRLVKAASQPEGEACSLE